MRRLLDHDPVSGVVEVFHHDPLTDVSTIETRHDCEPLLEHNKRFATANDGWSASLELRRVGSIPFGIYLQRLAEGLDALTRTRWNWSAAWPTRTGADFGRRRAWREAGAT